MSTQDMFPKPEAIVPASSSTQEEDLSTRSTPPWQQNHYSTSMLSESITLDGMVFNSPYIAPPVNTIRQELLYLCLYRQPFETNRRGDDPLDYGWSFIIGPRFESTTSKGILHQILYLKGARPGDPPYWHYHTSEIALYQHSNLLVRVIIGRIRHAHVLPWMLKSVPLVQDVPQSEFSCFKWAERVVEKMKEVEGEFDRLVSNFDRIKEVAMGLAQTRVPERSLRAVVRLPPTWDCVEERMVIE